MQESRISDTTAIGRPLTCVLIGDGSLIQSFGDFLKSRGHKIEMVVSDNSKVWDWAKKNHIEYFCEINKLSELTLKKYSFDYLLSIDNGKILNSSILSLPKIASINYHNSLLPKYAGLNATTWAILNNEKKHGITWHKMDQNIDSGDIIIQRDFRIRKNDTALSLNMRCYEEATHSFSDLLSALKKGCLSTKKQNLELRSYFSASNIVENNGFIDLSTPADHIYKMYRALYYGPYPNDICLLKIYIGGTVFIINNLLATDTSSSNRFGVLVDITENWLTVSTATKDISISLETFSGQSINHNRFTRLLGVRVGDFLPLPSKKYMNRYKRKYMEYKKNEDFWKKSLSHCIQPAILIDNAETGEVKKIKSMNFDISEKNIILSIYVALYKIIGYKDFTIWIKYDLLKKEVEYLKDTYVDEFPLTFKINQDDTYEKLFKRLKIDIENLRNRLPIERELFVRNTQVIKSLESKKIMIFISNEGFSPSKIDDFELIFHINERNEEVSLWSSHGNNTDLTDQNLLNNMLIYIFNISRNMLACRNLRITNIPLLNFDDSKKMIDSLKGDNYENPKFKNIIEAIKNSSTNNLSSAAILDKEIIFPYKVLIRDIDYLSKIMKEKNNEYIVSSSAIPVFFDRSYEMIVGILAVLNIGNSYVPLDKKWPISRVREIIGELKPPYILSDYSEFKSKFLESYELSLVDGRNFYMIKNTDEYLFYPAHIAYIIYTSGTTGRPKGVVVTEDNVINYHVWFKSTFNLDRNSVFDFSSSLAFDISVACTLIPLMSGSTIAICPETDKNKPRKYLDHLLKNKVTHVECTPSYLSKLLLYPEQVSKLKNLKYLLLGAEKLVKKDIVEWIDILPNNVVVNEYGPTECTVAVSSYFITKKNINALKMRIPIGKPSYNNSFVILDKYGNICPVGVFGVLHVCGKSVSQGYLHASENEKMKFRNDLSNKLIIGSCFNTGDIARVMYDKNIDLLGRLDKQVKIMGYRVELDSINNILTKHPMVSQSHVVFKQEDNCSSWLVAYLVLNKKNWYGITEYDIIDYMKERVPNYMIPSRYYVIGSIPLSVNEKIDESSLDKYSIYEMRNIRSIQSGTTEKLLQLVSDITGNKSINSHTSLFDAGLDSLMAIQLISIVENIFGVRISLLSILENKTIKNLSDSIISTINNSSSEKFRKKTLVCLRKSKGMPPIFLIHPIGGGGFWFRNIPKYLNESQSIYAFQDPSLETEGEFYFYSISEMAKFYIDEMKKIQSSGPYFIAGASFGSMVAIEMANQLNLTGEKVSFLGVFDGWANYTELNFIRHMTDENLFAYRKIFGDDQEFDSEWYLKLRKQRAGMLNKYNIPNIDTEITLFKATESEYPFDVNKDSLNYWGKYLNRTPKLYLVKGTHSTIFEEPNIKYLVNLLNKEILAKIGEGLPIS